MRGRRRYEALIGQREWERGKSGGGSIEAALSGAAFLAALLGGSFALPSNAALDWAVASYLPPGRYLCAAQRCCRQV